MAVEYIGIYLHDIHYNETTRLCDTLQLKEP